MEKKPNLPCAQDHLLLEATRHNTLVAAAARPTPAGYTGHVRHTCTRFRQPDAVSWSPSPAPAAAGHMLDSTRHTAHPDPRRHRMRPRPRAGDYARHAHSLARNSQSRTRTNSRLLRPASAHDRASGHHRHDHDDTRGTRSGSTLLLCTLVVSELDLLFLATGDCPVPLQLFLHSDELCLFPVQRQFSFE